MVLIIAGHYCVAEDYAELSHLAETEITSLKLGIEQYQSNLQQGSKVRLLIWVNDIGINPVQRERLHQHYVIPRNYADIISQAGILLSDVIIRFESQTRNRASKLLRQLKRHQPNLITEQSAENNQLIRCIDSHNCTSNSDNKLVLTINDSQGKPLVIKEGGAAKCCAILATFFSGLSDEFEAVKMIAVFNALYIERIKSGIYVAHTLLNFNTPFKALFCDESQTINSDYYSILTKEN